MAIQTQYPYIDADGTTHADLVKTYSDLGLTIIQVETATEYEDGAVDTYPSRFTYIEKPGDNEN